jgi:hypothetical protein
MEISAFAPNVAQMLGLILAAASASTMADPSDIRTFGDWAVGCDNRLDCRAIGRIPRGATDHLMLVIERAAEPAATATVRYPFDAFEPCTTFGVFVDGERQPGSFVSQCPHPRGTPAPPPWPTPRPNPGARGVDPNLPAIANGSILEYRRRDGSVAGRVSLRGTAAALRYMDERQRRVSTVTALVARGSASAATIPPPPPLPVVAEVGPSRPGPGAALSDRDAARLRRREGCDARLEPADYPSESYRLDDRSSVILLRCWQGPHNGDSLVLIAHRRDARDARPAAFDYNGSVSERSGPTVPPENGHWDEEKGRLVSHFRAECGRAEEWAWDGHMFRLIEQRAMVAEAPLSSNCVGDWITTWKAQVIPEGGR